LTGIAAFLKNAGVNDDETARRIAREFADEKGNVQFFNNPGQKKYADGDTLSYALLKAAEKITFFGDGTTPTTIPKPESIAHSEPAAQPRRPRLRPSVNTDAAGANAIENFLGQLGAARGTSSARPGN
jgi:hypothetical protein